jgi:branched-subunit amino acid aminotransferase/4-amino-4-deoxychorismate lyase
LSGGALSGGALSGRALWDGAPPAGELGTPYRVRVDVRPTGSGRARRLQATVSTGPLPPAQPPLVVVRGPRLRDAGGRLAGIKHTATAPVDDALAAARRAGADDVLLLDSAGRVSEASTSALVWASADMAGWATPSVACGPLASVTIAALADTPGVDLAPVARPVDALADQIRWMVLVNAIRGARAVGTLDGVALGRPPARVFTLVHAAITPPAR